MQQQDRERCVVSTELIALSNWTAPACTSEVSLCRCVNDTITPCRLLMGMRWPLRQHPGIIQDDHAQN
jgi:hypothetical protein